MTDSSDALIGALGSVIGGAVGAIGAFLCAYWTIYNRNQREEGEIL